MTDDTQDQRLTDAERIANLLAAHVQTVNWRDGVRHCRCGWTSPPPPPDHHRAGRWLLDEEADPLTNGALHRAHVADILAARSVRDDLLDDYDPVPSLVARGIMTDDHAPDSCEADCCPVCAGRPDPPRTHRGSG